MEEINRHKLVYDKMLPYAEKNLKKIKVLPGVYLGNKKCYHNARQRLETGESEAVCFVLSFIPRSGVNIHAVNKVGDTYVDNTLGYLSQFNNYFLIKEYLLEELCKLDETAYPEIIFDLVSFHKNEYLNKVFTKDELKELEIKHEHF